MAIDLDCSSNGDEESTDSNLLAPFLWRFLDAMSDSAYACVRV